MARATQKGDFPYEVEDPAAPGNVAFTCLLSLDKFNVDEDAEQKIKPSTETPLQFHLYTDMNEEKYGVHPRKFRLEYAPTVAEAANCTVATPKRYVEIPVLTIEQWNNTPEFDYGSTDAQDNAKIKINHSADGQSGLTYVVTQKIPERFV
jgi:hypothetical protein